MRTILIGLMAAVVGFAQTGTVRTKDLVVSNSATTKDLSVTGNATITTTLRPYATDGGIGALGNGNNNVFASDTARDTGFNGGGAYGSTNRLFSWNGFAAGTGNYIDGKISVAFGNTNIATANDSAVVGNRNVIGRRMYAVASQGVDNPGSSLGTCGTSCAFVVIADAQGDVSGYFPNAQMDGATVTSLYGAGATQAADGAVLPNGYSFPASLTFAMHPYMIVRDSVAETGITQVKILKTAYTGGVGTKIWYDAAASTYTTISYVYSSHSPVISVSSGPLGGNGQFASGVFSSTWGFGSTAFGVNARAWGETSFAAGYYAEALGRYSSAFGQAIKVTGNNSFGIALSNQAGTVLSQTQTLAIMGGTVGINTVAPLAALEAKQAGDEPQLRLNSRQTSNPSIVQFAINGSNGWEFGMSNLAGGYGFILSYGAFGTASNHFFKISNIGVPSLPGIKAPSGQSCELRISDTGALSTTGCS